MFEFELCGIETKSSYLQLCYLGPRRLLGLELGSGLMGEVSCGHLFPTLQTWNYCIVRNYTCQGHPIKEHPRKCQGQALLFFLLALQRRGNQA